MTILYRAMCQEEFRETLNFSSFSWDSRFKWFGTEEFVKSRVKDGKFNNSRFVPGRYVHLVRFEISDESLIHFDKCGFNEFMLDRRKANQVRILGINLEEESQRPDV